MECDCTAELRGSECRGMVCAYCKLLELEKRLAALERPEVHLPSAARYARRIGSGPNSYECRHCAWNEPKQYAAAIVIIGETIRKAEIHGFPLPIFIARDDESVVRSGALSTELHEELRKSGWLIRQIDGRLNINFDS